MPFILKLRHTGWLMAMLATASASGASAQTYRQAVADTQPIASFELDTPNAPSSNGLYTTNWQNVTSGPGVPLTGITGNNSAFFDGTGSTSQITTSLAGSTPGRGSIIAWINAAMLPSEAGRIFYIAGESQFANDFDFQYDQQDKLSFCVGAGECLVNQPTSNFVGDWHMVAAAYDGTRGGGLDTQSLYIDGLLVAGRAGDFSDAGHGNPFTIGYSSVFGGREFSGLIDEVSVYDRELNASEVAALYAARLTGAASAVPETATWAMMIAGFGAIGGSLRQRRRATAALA